MISEAISVPLHPPRDTREWEGGPALSPLKPSGEFLEGGYKGSKMVSLRWFSWVFCTYSQVDMGVSGP